MHTYITIQLREISQTEYICVANTHIKKQNITSAPDSPLALPSSHFLDQGNQCPLF